MNFVNSINLFGLSIKSFGDSSRPFFCPSQLLYFLMYSLFPLVFLLFAASVRC